MLTATTINKNENWCGLDLRWVYTDLLRNIFYHTKCMQVANDVLHDSMLRFVLSKNLQSTQEPHAYMRVVVRNLLADKFKENLRYEVLDVNDTEQNILHGLCEQWSPSPEQLVDLQQRMHAMQKVINCLPPKCREVFWLFRVEGLSQIEIAKQMNISLSMVERHMIRALIDISAARELLVGL